MYNGGFGFSGSTIASGSGGGGVPLNFSQTKGSQVTITAAAAKPATVVSTTITTQGNPVQIIVSGDANPSAAGWGRLNIYRDGTAVGQLVQFESSAANENVPYCLQVVDEPPAGTWTYSLKVTTVTTNTQFGEGDGPVITVTELGAEAGGGGGGAGITELTGDVTAGPGTGSVPATVARIQGYDVATTSPNGGQVLTWNAALSQWVPGDPPSGGSGGGILYYLNRGTAPQAPITGIPVPATVPVRQMGPAAVVAGSTVTSNVLSQVSYDLVANFVTDVGVPGITSIPAGLWDIHLWAASNANQANQTILQLRVGKYNSATSTLTILATSDDVSVYDPTVVAQYAIQVVIPAGTTLLSTERLYIAIYAKATQNNRTVSLHFGDSTPSHVSTTIPSAAGGDLDGTYPDPTVVAIQGYPVTASAPASNDVLMWNGSTWTHSQPFANISGTIAANEVAFGTALNTISGSGDLMFDGTSLKVTSQPGGGTEFFEVDGNTLSIWVHDSVGGNVDSVRVSPVGVTVDSSAGGGNPTLLLETVSGTPKIIASAGSGSLDLVLNELQVNGSPGTAGDVLTSNGPGSAPTWQAGSGTGFGSKVLLVVEGGSYATLQAAVDAASANDVILVGPKATGDWGNVTLNVVNKPLVIAAAGGAGSNKVVAVGSITYDLGTGAALNVNLNETYIYGLYIQGSFAGSAVTLTGGVGRPGRLRLYGCYILNTNATGAAAVTNSNQGANSSLYLDACVVSLSNSAAGSAIVQTAGYTLIRNRTDVGGSLAGGATGNAINVSAGTMEIYDSYISISRAVPTINVTGASTFVSVGYSTVLNSSDTAGACCAFIGTSGARFGAGDATLAAGSTLPTSAVAVSGVAGGLFIYANVSFSFTSTVSTVTSTATPQSGGLFSYGMSVGSLAATTFVVNSTGNITKLNNVTTSFPSAQGSSNQVLTNNGSGTLTWTNGNLRTLGSVGATPTAANLRTNATYTVNVAAVALPAMAAGDDGLTISLVNISGAGSTVTPSTGVARSMTTGGGQTWVWRNTGTTWYCISNV